MRPFKLPRAAILATLALASGVTASLAIAQHVRTRIAQIESRNHQPMVERIVAAYDLPAGTRLESAHLALRAFPVAWVASDALPAPEYTRLEGRTLRTAVRAGDALNTAQLRAEAAPFATQLAPGRRAMTLPVDQINSLSGLLRPGDLIDLYVSFDYQRKRLTAPLLQGVLVLATGRETVGDEAEDDPGAAGYGTVTLDTAPEDVLKLVAARQAGSLTAILRHPADGDANRQAVRGDLASLLGIASPPPAPARRAVVLYGSAGARALPAWARGEAPRPRAGNGLFELPGQPLLTSAWRELLYAETEAAVQAGLTPALDGADWSTATAPVRRQP